MKRQILLLFQLLIISLPCQTFAQYSQHFTQIEKTNTSMYGETYHVFQDSYGIIWVGTTSGLVKYDGYELKTYIYDRLDNRSLPSNGIRRIFEDSFGRLWLGIDDFGLCIYQRDHDNFLRIPFSEGEGELHSDFLFNILQDQDSVVWFAGDEGLQYLLPGTDSVFHFYDYVEGNHGRINFSTSNTKALCLDDNDNLWIGSSGGIEMIPASRDTVFSYKTDPTFPDVRCSSILKDEEGTLWFAMFEPPVIYTWDHRDPGFKVRFPEIEVQGDSRSVIDLEERIWITWLGDALLVIDKERESYGFYPTNKATPFKTNGQYLRQPTVDIFGNLWMSGGGFFQVLPYTGKKILHYEFPFESGGAVSAILQTDSFLLIGQLFGGLVIRDLQTGEEQRFLDDTKGAMRLTSNRVYSIREMSDGKFLLTTSTGAQIMDLQTRTMRTILDKENLVRWSYIDRDERIWLFLERRGILLFDPPYTKGHWILRDGKDDVLLPRQMVVDENGGCWIASQSDGLIYYHPETREFKQFTPLENDLNSISGYKAECIHRDDAGILWIGTRSGLNRYDPYKDSFSLVSIDQGLVGFSIGSIVEDDKSRLWLATNNGMSCYNPSTGEIRNYNTDDGFINPNYYPRASFQSADGRIFLGGLRGLDIFNPDEIGVNPFPPRIVLIDFLVKNVPYHLGIAPENVKGITLDYKDDFFEFVFSGLHYTTPTKIRYSYMLEGFHDDWVDNGYKRSVSFTGLSPGNYTFRVKAENGDGIWSEDMVIGLNILPPFYMTWWFFILSGLLMVSASYGLYRYRINSIRKEERQKAEFQKRLAQVEMQALRAQMNPHFLFNSLNSVKSYIGQNKVREAQDYLTAFAKLVRQVLNNSRKNTVRLNDDLHALKLYLELEKMRFQNFEYSLNVETEVNADFIEVPPLLLQPFVENAIWHGLMHKLNGTRNVDIDIRRNGEVILMTVEDNGIGREKAAALQTRSSSKKEALGMKITEERLHFLKELYGENASINIEDLHEPTGTRVTIQLPLPD